MRSLLIHLEQPVRVWANDEVKVGSENADEKAAVLHAPDIRRRLRLMNAPQRAGDRIVLDEERWPVRCRTMSFQPIVLHLAVDGWKAAVTMVHCKIEGAHFAN
jgi:hypothetical protein